MGVVKRIKKIERQIKHTLHELRCVDMYLFCADQFPDQWEKEVEKERALKLKERLRYLENELSAEKFELNCIKGTMILVLAATAFVLLKYVLL
tara:strand:- start:89 stop:367 length:279 start_codon:yes stop_codon:yes gene_type:complete